MIKQIREITIGVRDLDLAVNWYTENLNMELHADFQLDDGSRFVTIGLNEQHGLDIILYSISMQEINECQRANAQSPHWVLFTDDLSLQTNFLRERGVTVRESRQVPWGNQVYIEDLDGNPFILVGPS